MHRDKTAKEGQYRGWANSLVAECLSNMCVALGLIFSTGQWHSLGQSRKKSALQHNSKDAGGECIGVWVVMPMCGACDTQEPQALVLDRPAWSKAWYTRPYNSSLEVRVFLCWWGSHQLIRQHWTESGLLKWILSLLIRVRSSNVFLSLLCICAYMYLFLSGFS